MGGEEETKGEGKEMGRKLGMCMWRREGEEGRHGKGGYKSTTWL